MPRRSSFSAGGWDAAGVRPPKGGFLPRRSYSVGVDHDGGGGDKASCWRARNGEETKSSSTYLCSQLVGDALQYMGVLGEEEPGDMRWLWVFPGAFGQGGLVEKGLAPGVSLGEEVRWLLDGGLGVKAPAQWVSAPRKALLRGDCRSGLIVTGERALCSRRGWQGVRSKRFSAIRNRGRFPLRERRFSLASFDRVLHDSNKTLEFSTKFSRGWSVCSGFSQPLPPQPCKCSHESLLIWSSHLSARLSRNRACTASKPRSDRFAEPCRCGFPMLWAFFAVCVLGSASHDRWRRPKTWPSLVHLAADFLFCVCMSYSQGSP